MSMKDPQVSELMQHTKKWPEEMAYLRRILLDCLLIETYKWASPVYMFGSQNLIGIASLKEHCALNFFKGGLLQDTEGLLIKPGENSNSARWMKFSSVEDIQAKESIIKAYVFEAIEAEKLGLKIDRPAQGSLEIPAELQSSFESNAALKAAFEKLTPGRQRAYIMYFSDGKQSATRMARIEKNERYILLGKGLTDCVCGLTKKKPGCDGSHRAIENFKR
jgi:uncharacterized protein YdeI (YjbR/CyaY-like superfamily)